MPGFEMWTLKVVAMIATACCLGPFIIAAGDVKSIFKGYVTKRLPPPANKPTEEPMATWDAVTYIHKARMQQLRHCVHLWPTSEPKPASTTTIAAE